MKGSRILKFLSLILFASLAIASPYKRRKSPKFIEKREDVDGEKAVISKFHVDTTIQFRYARTVVTSHVKNPGIKAVKADFFMIIPDSAFISNLSMIIGEEGYVSGVKKADEAANEYEKAVTDGRNTAIVSKSSQSRNTNRFNVDANIAPGDKVVFKLTYEEQLERKDGQYEYGVVIDPRAVIDDFKVEVNINESLPLTNLFVPELLESNVIDFVKGEVDNSIAVVTTDVDGSANNARVVFKPDQEYQEAAGEQGMAGKLVVRYDVDRSNQENEVQVIDGYFVHYLVPDNLPTLPKHIVFVLDVSGSMDWGNKLEQMKDAIFTVLDDMTEKDHFTMITFSSSVSIWDQDKDVPVLQATEANKADAIARVLKLIADGGTNINDAIVEALDVSKTAASSLPADVKSMIVFLTDGLPSEGVTDPVQIQDNIKYANLELGIPVFTIAFGSDADFDLVEKIASANQGAAKKIYEGSDAALQLEDFYAEVSSPILTNLNLSYVGGLDETSQVSTKTLFKGKELIVVGKLSNDATAGISISIDADGKEGQYRKEIMICPRTTTMVDSLLEDCHRPVEFPKSDAQQFLQHLFAYINIQQMLETIEKSKDKSEIESLKSKATNLALDNNFVTDLTSLVVVKPDEDPLINTLVTDVLSEGEIPSPFFSAGSSSSSNVQHWIPKSSSVSYYSSNSNNRKYNSPRVVMKSGPSVTHKKRPQFTPPPPSMMSYDNDYDYGYGVQQSLFISTTFDDLSANCDGNITFYTKTYHRGDELEVEDDMEDLEGFDNVAVSAIVSGDCCWQIFAEKGYSGINKILTPSGEYKGVSSLGSDLFRNVSSVKKTIC